MADALQSTKDFMQPLMIVRYGGYGDQIIWTSVLPFLMEKHHPIRLEVTYPGLDLFLPDDRFEYVSGFDHIVNAENDEERVGICKKRWGKLKEDCDKTGARFINFWSSIENVAIIPEGHSDMYLPREDRERKYNKNAYEIVFEMAEIAMPSGWMHRDTLKFHKNEVGVVERWRDRCSDFFCVLVALAGSSRQKVFPTWIESFCKKLVDSFPRLKLYLMGGMEVLNDIWQYERTVSCIGIPFRQSALMTKYSDYVFGADTGLSVAAGMMGTPKTTLFNIMNKDQIVKYHENDYSLQSTSKCSPCYVMAYNGDMCEAEPVYHQFPICTHEFDLDTLFNTIETFYMKRF